MASAAEIPSFGRAPAGVHVVRRPSAYAVASGDDGLLWLAPAAAVAALDHESHRWAVERWLERAVDGELKGE